MSTVQPTRNPVIAILCADLHLSDSPPIARAGEASWYDAMGRAIGQLDDLANTHACHVVCAGDIFHHWKSPPRLINWALDKLPRMVAIPGQHDLPYHDYAARDSSAYGTVCRNNVDNMPPGQPYELAIHYGRTLYIAPFPWGCEPMPLDALTKDRDPEGIYLAVVHKYMGVPGKTYAGAPADAMLGPHNWPFLGYHAVVVGDNHIAWDYTLPAQEFGNHPACHVFNPGSLMRRAGDQLTHKPRVGLLHLDGTVTSHYLDTTADQIAPVLRDRDAAPRSAELEAFIENMRDLREHQLDFQEALKRALARPGVSPAVRNIILETLA